MEEISKTTILQPLTLNQKSSAGDQEATEDVCVCIFCEHSERNEGDNKKILSHIYFNHRMIISDAQEIVDIKEYLAYWKEQFNGQQIEEYCTTMHLKQLPDGTRTENDEKYYLLADIVPKDTAIRLSLQKKLIEKALERHQFERSDANFVRGCLFCRSSSIETTRYGYVEHLYSKHFLHLGKPENLVFVDELVDFIEDKLNNLVCIFCEKIFKDRATLKEHMRKKGHKKINPEIKSYDRFFMINYKIKEMSTHVSERKLPFVNERRAEEEDDREIFCNDDSEWSEWSEKEGEIQIMCLFCSHKNENFDTIISHMLEVHGFNFEELTASYNFYQKVKLINYIRRKVHLKQCLACDESFETREMLLNHLSSERHLNCDPKSFDKPEFFFPTFEDDTFLCHLDNFNEEEDEMSDDSFAVVSEDRHLAINEDAEMLSREKFIEI